MKRKAAARFRAAACLTAVEIVGPSPRSITAATEINYSLATVRGAGLLISICALTFWICAACAFSEASVLPKVQMARQGETRKSVSFPGKLDNHFAKLPPGSLSRAH
jgi:H+/gluconate symporter-like permease